MTAVPDGSGEALATALEYAAAGYAVGPVTIRWDPVRGKKSPDFHTNWGDPDATSADPDRITAWARAHPGCGFHMPCGPNGVVVPEGDVKRAREDGTTALKDGITAWRDAGGPRPTMIVHTPSGGEHWYFPAPAEDIHGSQGVVLPGVDVRGALDTVFIAGSRVHGHPNGADAFYWTDRVVPASELAPLPEHWERRLRGASKGSGKSASAPTGPAPGFATPEQFHDLAWIEDQVIDARRRADALGPGDFRHEFYGVAVTLYTAATAGVIGPDEVDEVLTDAVARVWHAPPDADDRTHMADARARAAAKPWRVSVGAREDRDPEGDMGAPEPPAPGAQYDDPPGATGAPVDDPPELTGEQLAAQRWERDLAEEYRRLSLRREAQLRLDAEHAPELIWLDSDAFLDGPEPEPIVPHMLYRDSLSRIYGAPGCGKSFLSLDLAHSVALGRDWGGAPVERARVAYVMAEGQRVNTRRARAWLERHGVDRSDLSGWFHAVPHKVLLTEGGVAGLVEKVRAHDIGVVILDTKNRMMIGDENSAEDNGIMLRALDNIREATGCAVVLVDHTGLADSTRARGSTAAIAGMETEIQVDNDGGRPAKVTVTTTRDKGDEDGTSWEFFLRAHPLADGVSSAVLVLPSDDLTLPEARPAPEETERKWQVADLFIPDAVLDYTGEGKAAVPDLARYMAHDAGIADPDGIGVTQAQAKKALSVTVLGKARGYHESSVRRAWSALRRLGYLVPADGRDGSDGKAENLVMRHVWECAPEPLEGGS